jgi:hypothetical protein
MADIEILGIVEGIQMIVRTDTEILGTVGGIQMIVGQTLKYLVLWEKYI